jgi:hypothetical protein
MEHRKFGYEGVDLIPLAQDMVSRELSWNPNFVCRIQKSASFGFYPEGTETNPQYYVPFLKLSFDSIIQHSLLSQI